MTSGTKLFCTNINLSLFTHCFLAPRIANLFIPPQKSIKKNPSLTVVLQACVFCMEHNQHKRMQVEGQQDAKMTELQKSSKIRTRFICKIDCSHSRSSDETDCVIEMCQLQCGCSECTLSLEMLPEMPSFIFSSRT